MYCYGGVEESKGSDGEEEEDRDAAAPLPHGVAPVEAPSGCSGASRRVYDAGAIGKNASVLERPPQSDG
jgi:hypothetical protein